MTEPSPSLPSVLVVGAGVSGLACARALQEGGVAVRVVDRGRVAGGRLATKRVAGRPADIGARYFTAPPGSAFAAAVEGWQQRGLVREWTDTFESVTLVDGVPDAREQKTGPLRYSAADGLRALPEALAADLRADGVAVETGRTVTGVAPADDGGLAMVTFDGDSGPEGQRYAAVVLAMPDPQAGRLLAPGSPTVGELGGAHDWEPALAVVLGWSERHWPVGTRGVFVGGSPVLAFVADDGDRRGDGAPVLVAHTTGEFAREHLEHPEAAAGVVTDAVRALFAIDGWPDVVHVHRWTFASPGAQHSAPYLLRDGVGVCGDAWGERSSVSTAWASGDALGRELAVRLRG